MEKYKEKIKKLVMQEYIYIYMHKVVMAKLQFEPAVSENSFTILTNIDKSYDYFIIEVKDEK